MLHEHINGYFDDFINFKETDTIIDVGANIGIFGIELSDRYSNINVISFEPMLDIFNVLKENAIVSKNSNFKIVVVKIVKLK